MTSRVTEPTVSIVVVNYNGRRFLEEFFQSLHAAFVRHSFEIIVVDNASSDGSAEWLRHTPGIHLVALRVNTGFTGGNNIGARLARGRVLLLLNNDTRVLGTLDTLIDEALDPQVGAVGCRLRFGDGRLQHSIGLEHTVPRIVLSWLGLEKQRGAPALLRKFETKSAVYDRYRPDVAWVSGACLATRREVWQRLGGLDADMFMYCEDVDYCRRVRDVGLRVAYLPSAEVVHYEGGGRAWPGVNALLRTTRAYFIYIAKTRGLASARALSASLACVFSLRALVFRALALTGRGLTNPKRALHREKAVGFSAAGAHLIAAAWSGRVPPLP